MERPICLETGAFIDSHPPYTFSLGLLKSWPYKKCNTVCVCVCVRACVRVFVYKTFLLLIVAQHSVIATYARG